MIKVLAKADRILRLVSERPGIPFGDLTEALGWHKATLSNILKTLTDLGYTARDEDGGCRIGPTLLALGNTERRRDALPALAEECACTVARALRETTTVGRLIAGDRFNLAKATVDRTVAVDARIELRPSPYDTATGRTLLAFCAPEDLQAVIDKHGLPGAAWEEASSRGKMQAALEAIRRQGYAELRRGDACTFAVPILDGERRLIASVGTVVPAYRLEATELERILEILRDAADQMAHGLDLVQI